MIGSYARLTPAQFDQAVGDTDWARKLVTELVETQARDVPACAEGASGASVASGAEGLDGAADGGADTGAGAGGGTTSRRCLDVDKAWDALDFLLRRAGVQPDVIHGEESLPGAGAGDWGHGPPSYLTPERVRTAAAALAALPGGALFKDVTVAELARADLYPGLRWDDEQWPAYVVRHYAALSRFFQAAAGEGDAVLVWLA